MIPMPENQTVSERNFRLRRAHRDDLFQIVQLLCEDTLGVHPEQVSEPLPPSYLQAFRLIEQDQNNELIVAELDGKVIGTFQLTWIPYLSHQGSLVAQIESVRVKKEFRNQGWGRRMMEWAIARAREKQCYRVQLTTNKRRKEAHRFYQSLGFSPTHEGMKLSLCSNVVGHPLSHP